VVVYEAGRWLADDQASALRVVVLANKTRSVLASAWLPATRCGGDLSDAAYDRVGQARIAARGALVLIVAHAYRLPSLLEGRASVAHDLIYFVAHVDAAAPSWSGNPQRFASPITTGETIEALVPAAASDTSGTAFYLLTSHAAAGTILLRRFRTATTAWETQPPTVVFANLPAQSAGTRRRVSFVPSSATLGSQNTYLAGIQGAANNELVLAVTTNAGATFSAARRTVGFIANTYIEANAGGSYATRETSAFDLANQPAAAELGAHAVHPLAAVPVNRSAVHRRGLGAPRVATMPGVLAAVAGDGRASSSRTAALSKRSCNAHTNQVACTVKAVDAECRPDPQQVASACRKVVATLDQASLFVSTNDALSLTTALPVPVDPQAVAAGDQTVAYAVAANPRSHTIGVLYEQLTASGASSLKVAFFAPPTSAKPTAQRLGELLLHRAANVRRQAYSEGTFHGDDLVLLPHATDGGYTVVYSRVSVDASLGPALVHLPASGIDVDPADRSTMVVVAVDPQGL